MIDYSEFFSVFVSIFKGDITLGNISFYGLVGFAVVWALVDMLIAGLTGLTSIDDGDDDE